MKTAHLKTIHIDDIFSLWTLNREEIVHFFEQANKHRPTNKFTAEISETFIKANDSEAIQFLMCERTSNLVSETFQYTHFSSCHPPGIKLNYAYGKEVIPRTLFKRPCKRCNLKTGNWLFFKTQRRTNESCFSLPNNTQQCQT